ncbi:MAG: adenylate/guanylate cyclase domain-containing protein [Gammaproteobacteria bacterium]|nr:adenylate/guanylate cyclase domain-containing protein [Gammaproteobacteria bacterium]
MRFKFNLGSDISIQDGLLDQMLQYGAVSLPEAVKTPEFLVFVLIGLTLCISLPLLSPIKASVLTLVSMIPPVYMSYAAPTKNNLLPMEYSLLTVLMLFVVNVLMGYFIETHAKQKIINLFGQYVPSEVVGKISKQAGKLSLDGESRELTVIFCDLKNFSAISEQLNPKQLVQLLNGFFTAMTKILHEHGATIDKYMGDAIMAFWGAPLVQPDHAERAVLAALHMQKEILNIRTAFKQKGWPEIGMGIGINTGVMNVGNMGSEFRVAYTIVGDAVNLGSRLEPLTRVYKVDAIVSESTKQAVDSILFKELDLVQVRGKQVLTRIFQPLCPNDEADEALIEHLERHDEALQCYYRREWENARSMFKRLGNQNRDYAGYYALLIEKIDAHRESPPPDDWEGETRYYAL